MKVFRSVNKFKYVCKLFQLFGIGTFHYLGFSTFKKNEILQKFFFWNITFCDFHINGMPKSPTSVKLAWCWNSILWENTKLNSVSFFQKLFFLWWNFRLKSIRFLSFQRSTDSPENPESATNEDLFRYSHWLFSPTTRLISSI